ncbi:MAG: hypothetical protein C3F14_05960 [Deltaproteobacteria bacterium]|nr:MAG: hypothetical protein C3F14_05960 [Deltaproteobacteria bacterium]
MPFPAERTRPGITIAGSVGRRTALFTIVCTIQGDLSTLAIPAPDPHPGRKDGLWEKTCLEFFLGGPDTEAYWEFNLSPSGHWNVYRFTSYRQGMREEPAFASLPFRMRKEPERLVLSLELDIGKLFPKGDAMQVAICAVFKTMKGGISHWALAHAGHRPDFHRREGFALTLPGE